MLLCEVTPDEIVAAKEARKCEQGDGERRELVDEKGRDEEDGPDFEEPQEGPPLPFVVGDDIFQPSNFVGPSRFVRCTGRVFRQCIGRHFPIDRAKAPVTGRGTRTKLADARGLSNAKHRIAKQFLAQGTSGAANMPKR